MYNVDTPEQYLSALEDDWRKEKLLVIRQLLFSNCSGLKETINYKMLAYSDDRGPLFHLNAQKNYVSLYIGDAKKVDPTGDLLEGIDVGKGCLRFKKSTDLGKLRIEEFIQRTFDLWKKGEDVGC